MLDESFEWGRDIDVIKQTIDDIIQNKLDKIY